MIGEAGVDEVGRGPLAGPVVAAAVVLPPQVVLPGLTDSKRLSARRREQFAAELQRFPHAISVIDVETIDRINILQASLLAMREAVCALPGVPERVLVDGNRLPEGLPCSAQAMIGGDLHVPAISAASILAKVHRDALMVELDRQFPGYGLAAHKGYPTAAHLDALKRLGPSCIHRRSFAPVRRLLRPN